MSNQINVLSLSRHAQPPNRRTDSIFSLEGSSRDPLGGLDVITPDGERYFLTTIFPGANDALVRKHLGDRAILPYVKDEDGLVAVYRVPRGAIPLRSALERPPYSLPYIETMFRRAEDMLRGLHDLDPAGFGVTFDDLALAYDLRTTVIEPDITFLAIIPPLVISASHQE